MEYLPCVKRLIGLWMLSLSASAYAHDLHYFVVENIAAPLQIVDEEKIHNGIVTDIVTEIARLAELDIKITVAPSP